MLYCYVLYSRGNHRQRVIGTGNSASADYFGVFHGQNDNIYKYFMIQNHIYTKIITMYIFIDICQCDANENKSLNNS